MSDPMPPTAPATPPSSIDTQLAEIKETLARAVPSYEDLTSWNVYDRAYKLLVHRFALWLGAVSVALTVVGYTTVKDIKEKAESRGRDAAQQMFAKEYGVKLDEEIRKQVNSALPPLIEKRVTAEMRPQFARAMLDLASKTEVDLGTVSANLEAQSLRRFETAVTRLGVVTSQPRLAADVRRELSSTRMALSGFAYYGVSREGGGVWDVRNFDNGRTNVVTMPEVGDTVRAIVPVNARAGLIRYDPNRGWFNAPIAGYIAKGRSVRVIAVENIANGFIWIQFTTVD